MLIVKYSAEWCSPCKQLAAMLKTADVDIKIESVDVDVEHERAVKDSIRGVPTMIIFNGDKALSRKVGMMTKDSFQEWVKSIKE